MKINPKKGDVLFSPVKMEKLLQKVHDEKIKQVKIQPIKQYKDPGSFSLVAVYTVNRTKKFIGSAHSDGRKEYDYKITKFLAERMKAVPPTHFYSKSHGLLIRKYVRGKTLHERLEENNGITLNMALEIAEWLKALQKIKPPAFVKKGVDFYNIKKNIQLIEKRKVEEKEKKKLKKKILETIEEIKTIEKKNKQPVLVHGDLNPFNIIFNKNKLAIIDLEKIHLGDRVLDAANFCSHLHTLPELKITAKEKKLSEKNFQKAFNRIFGNFTPVEKSNFEIYKKYFTLLAVSHQMAWGDPYKITIDY